MGFTMTKKQTLIAKEKQAAHIAREAWNNVVDLRDRLATAKCLHRQVDEQWAQAIKDLSCFVSGRRGRPKKGDHK